MSLIGHCSCTPTSNPDPWCDLHMDLSEDVKMNTGAREMREDEAEACRQGRHQWVDDRGIGVADSCRACGLVRCPNHPQVIGQADHACPICENST